MSGVLELAVVAYLVVRLDVQLDLFAGEGADSVGGVWLADLCYKRIEKEEAYLICMLGGALCVGEVFGGEVVLCRWAVFDWDSGV